MNGIQLISEGNMVVNDLYPIPYGYVKEALLVARSMIDKKIRSGRAKDTGTCVMGAGIVFNGITVINQPFQGNVGSYEACKPALEYLQKRFPTAEIKWYDGIMD